MHRVFNRVARGVLAVAVVVSLTIPATARMRDDERSGGWMRPETLRILKLIVIRGFGDGLIVPRP